MVTICLSVESMGIGIYWIGFFWHADLNNAWLICCVDVFCIN
jgi:nitroreductase